jgi:hypothetical protein
MRRLLAAAVAVASLLPAAPSGASHTELPPHRAIHFPVEGAVSFQDDFGAPRDGGERSHLGNDLFGRKLQPLLAAVDGTITYIRADAGGISGNMLTIRDSAGWRYHYIHLNNDSPETDDGANPRHLAFAGGITTGSRVSAGQVVGFMGDSGNAEHEEPQLHFEIRRPDGVAINPWTSLRIARNVPPGTRCAYDRSAPRQPTEASGRGYHVLAGDGNVRSFGAGVRSLGSGPDALRIASTRSGNGYWVLGRDGGIFSFGDAQFHDSVPGLNLGVPVQALDLQPTATGRGYWVLGSDGGVFSFGDADFFGSVPGLGIRTSTLRLVPTPTGNGYWILGADGGVFSFGDAQFHGSVPGLGLRNVPVVAMTASPAGGYWVLGADGGVFSFGVPFFGSIPGRGLCTWPHGVQMVSSATGQGYWVLADDGSVWQFGDATFLGDVPGAGGLDMAVVAPTR